MSLRSSWMTLRLWVDRSIQAWQPLAPETLSAESSSHHAQRGRHSTAPSVIPPRSYLAIAKRTLPVQTGRERRLIVPTTKSACSATWRTACLLLIAFQFAILYNGEQTPIRTRKAVLE
ncbi:hypothetical protein C8034_v010755 [Colletotrichum sidae]|uniref:Uncharacterized protein n=1 Tax=Colletotrichum sidae TaxID=1347389 RepID=A0A4R8T171_9PEZI|nr:hypothetical protein C8034_v010755 [Colletotrichum sidae]